MLCMYVCLYIYIYIHIHIYTHILYVIAAEAGGRRVGGNPLGQVGGDVGDHERRAALAVALDHERVQHRALHLVLAACTGVIDDQHRRAGAGFEFGAQPLEAAPSP